MTKKKEIKKESKKKQEDCSEECCGLAIIGVLALLGLLGYGAVSFYNYLKSPNAGECYTLKYTHKVVYVDDADSESVQYSYINLQPYDTTDSSGRDTASTGYFNDRFEKIPCINYKMSYDIMRLQEKSK